MTAPQGTTDRWLEELLSWVGTAENPAGSNHTPIGARFGWNGVAWCCETQSVVLYDTWGRKILWTAGVADAIERARRGENGMQLLGPTAIVQVGDLPTYDYGGRGNPANFHIEGVINPGTQSKFETVGGNVRDACRRQWRDRTYVTHFIRPPFAAGSTGLGSPPKEADKVLHICRGDDPKDKNPAWFVTDLITKRHIITPAEAANIIVRTRANGGTCVDDGHNGPQIWSQADVDAIRTV